MRQCIKNWPFTVIHPVWRVSIAALASLLVLPGLAHAHGGMGPDEVGPPLITSGVLGFVSYWAVMLWPSAKKNDNQDGGVRGQGRHAPPMRTARVRRRPRLRKITGNAQLHGDLDVRRKASDG
ncbi:MAG TPA: hypothetical protein VNN62_22735 [Methylomirabilota bacterium]|nr:hypothetical protein [Methylomirabilota bacterium]